MTRATVVEEGTFGGLVRSASPDLAFGVRLAASVSLALFAAFWLELDNAFWAAASAAVVCQPNLGASLRKAWFRLIGTLVGAAAIVAIAALFTQDRVGFLAALALWGAICALLSTLLRNFASYGAALAGYTAAIVARDALGASGGGPDDHVFNLALWRASEICTGIVCAGVVFALTDFGATRSRLANMIGVLIDRIGSQFASTLSTLKDSRVIRREFIRDVIALDPVIDQAIGESFELRYDSSTLARTANGLFSALAAWRAVDNHFYRERAMPGMNRTAGLRSTILPLCAVAVCVPFARCFRSPPSAPRDSCSLIRPPGRCSVCPRRSVRWLCCSAIPIGGRRARFGSVFTWPTGPQRC